MTEKTILFRAVSVTSSAAFVSPGCELSFDLLLKESNLRIEATPTQLEDPWGEPYQNILVSATTCETVRAPALAVFQDPRAFRPADFSIDDIESFTFDRERYPQEYWELINAVSTRLSSAKSRILGLVYWRLALAGSPRAIGASDHLLWKFGKCIVDDSSGAHWNSKLPHGIVVEASGWEEPKTVQVSVGQIEDLKKIEERLDASPLAHDLLQEAWTLAERTPRAALVIGVAAAETRLKEVTGLARTSLTSMMNRLKSTASAGRIVLPNGETVKIPRKLATRIESINALRNAIVHGEGSQEHVIDVLKHLRDLSDVLYVCDYFSGEAWALEVLSESTRRELSLA